MKPSRPPFDLLLLLAIAAGLLTVGLVAPQPAPLSTFQSPPPVLSYAKTVDKTQAQVNDLLTYNIIITNTGGPTADTLVVDSLSPQVTWLGSVTASYGTAAYAPFTRRIGWVGSLQPASTLVISWSVVITAAPLNAGQILTNSFIAVSDSTAVATRFVETTIFTGTPFLTRPPPIPTAAPPVTPSSPTTPTALLSPTPGPSFTPSVTATVAFSPAPLSTGSPATIVRPASPGRPSPADTPVSRPSPSATPLPMSVLPGLRYLPETGQIRG